MKLPIKKNHLIFPVILFGALLAFYPFESVVVPEWKLEVRDVSGNICTNMRVTESWAHYSLFLSPNGGTDNRFTDLSGVVKFPAKTVRATGIRRVVVPIIAHILLIAHGSVGANGAVSASGIKNVAWLSYKPGRSLPDKMIVEKCISGDY